MSWENKKDTVIYYKMTNYCNVGCKHCYISTLERKDFKTISLDQAKEVRRKLENYFIKDENIDFLWHGGEPLAIPFDELNVMLKEFNKSNLNFKNILQSSLVPLFGLTDEELKKYIKIIKIFFGSWVGTSYDFGGVRSYKGSPENYRANLKRILNIFKKNGIDSGVTVTITKALVDSGVDELFSFVEEFDSIIYNMTFERYNEYGVEESRKKKSSLSLTNLEYSEFMIEVYDEYKKRKPNTILQLFKDLEFGIKNNVGTDKWGGKCLHNNLVINPDGSINNCVDKADEESFGNIFEDEIVDIIKNKSRQKWIRVQDVEHKTSDCFSCEYQYVCNSGCPLIKNEIKTDKLECSGYYRLIRHVDLDNETKL